MDTCITAGAIINMYYKNRYVRIAVWGMIPIAICALFIAYLYTDFYKIKKYEIVCNEYSNNDDQRQILEKLINKKTTSCKTAKFEQKTYFPIKEKLYVNKYKSSIPHKNYSIPYAIDVSPDIKKFENIIVWIEGGPGSKILEHTNILLPTHEFFYDISTKCKAPIFTVAYSGTYDRSEYPNSSIDKSIKEIDVFLDYMKSISKNKNIVLLTPSLGFYLYSASKKNNFDYHISLVPLVNSPEKLMSYVVNDKSVGTKAAISRMPYYDFIIGNNKKPTKINGNEFIRNYFGQTKYNKMSFKEFWGSENEYVEQKKSTIILLGNDDVEAGDGYKFAPLLKKSGFNAVSLPFTSHKFLKEDIDLLKPYLKNYLPKSCDSL